MLFLKVVRGTVFQNRKTRKKTDTKLYLHSLMNCGYHSIYIVFAGDLNQLEDSYPFSVL